MKEWFPEDDRVKQRDSNEGRKGLHDTHAMTTMCFLNTTYHRS